MQYRRLGRSDLRVSVVGMGCWAFAGDATWGPQDDADTAAAVHAALDLGINFFDTAAVYGNGRSEQALGKALGRGRDKAVIATKLSGHQLRAGGVAEACETSLRNLGTDVIDLYQIHWPSREVPFDETAKAMDDLQRAGKVRCFGVSNFLDQDFAEMMAVKRFESDQMPYNLLTRAVEFICTTHCIRHQVSLICYSPLAQGLLTGKFKTADDVPPGRARLRHFAGSRPQSRHGEPGAEKETFDAIAAIQRISDELGLEMGAVSLGWLLTRPAVATVIAGGRDAAQVRSNAQAASITLPSEVVSRLTEATDVLKDKLGPNADMWETATRSRMR